MNNGENDYNSITKSISKQSEYSDAYENYEDVNKYSNTNSIEEKKITNTIINRRSINFEESSNDSKNISIIKKNNSIYIPEDSKEPDVLNLYKTKNINPNYISNDISLGKDNSQINEVNDSITNLSDEIKENLNINNIKNERMHEENYNDINEDLYSERGISEKLTKNESEVNFLTNKKKPEMKVTKLKKSIEHSGINFDFNLEPLDTVSNNTDKKNKKYKNKKVKKTFKKLLSYSKSNLKESLSSAMNFRKLTSIDINGNLPSEFTKSIRRKRDFFDPNNILRKVVIMNGKKSSKNINLKDSIKTDLSNQFNLSINEVQLPIDNIKFNKIKIDELETIHLKKILRLIEVESKRNNPNKNFFKTLIELQNFYIDNSSVWVIKLSPNGKYLAGGCKSGKIKIYEVIDYTYSKFRNVYEPNNLIEYLNFISETPYKTLERHKSDIIDLSWSPFFQNLILSASLDHFVCLWDISQEKNCLIKEYEHSDMATSVCFNPFFKNVFMSGCLEHFVHIWKFDIYEGLDLNVENNFGIYTSAFHNSLFNKSEKKSLKEEKDRNNTFGDADKTNANLETINKEDSIDYFNIPQKITSVAFFPDGTKIAIGGEKGKIFVYNTLPKINYSHNFFVAKKKFGIFHGGKKVTNIQFIDKNYAIVSTADSVIRYVHMNKGIIVKQYKGYENKYSMTRAYADLADDVIIVGGEDGNCYAWRIYEKIKEEKNKEYERFKPFAKETVECSIIAHERCYINYMQKILKLTNKILILNIIINGTSNGRLEILLNIKEK